MIYNVWFSQNENPELSNLYPRGFVLENPSLPEIPVDSKVEFTHLSKYKSKDIWTVEFPRILTVIRNNILSEVN